MRRFYKHAPPPLLLLLALAAACQGQTVKSYMRPMGSLDSARDGSFSSLEGRFSIALPKSIGGFSGVGGTTFSWRLTEGFFSAGYVERDHNVETSGRAESEVLQRSQAALDRLMRDVLEGPVAGAQVTNKQVRLGARAGVETRVEMPNGVALARSYAAGRRVYSLVALLVGEQRRHEARAVEVFDSFRLAAEEDSDAVMRRKVEEATPKPLPQQPAARRPRSDAEDENLKGRVKSVVEETQGLSGRMADKPRVPSSEAFYNEQGDLIKRVFYNSAGYPRDITVYGYVDGERVSSSGSIRYESDPPGVLVQPAGEPKKRDPRYEYRHAYRYDGGGRLGEKLLYGSDGDLLARTVYKREGGRLEELQYSPNGSLNSRRLAVLDKDGNEAEETYHDSPMKGWTTKYTHAYEFDAKGNWVKRTTTQTRTFQGISRVEATYVTYRTITYH